MKKLLGAGARLLPIITPLSMITAVIIGSEMNIIVCLFANLTSIALGFAHLRIAQLELLLTVMNIFIKRDLKTLANEEGDSHDLL